MPDTLAAEDQGKLDPQAPAYVLRRGQMEVEANGLAGTESLSKSVKDASLMA